MADVPDSPPPAGVTPLTVPLADLTLEQLLNLGIVGVDNDKNPNNVNEAPGYALRLKQSDLVAIAELLAAKLQPALRGSARGKAAAKKPMAKKAAAKKPTATKSTATRSTAKKVLPKVGAGAAAGKGRVAGKSARSGKKP
jgi:hypothetical protein